VYCVLGATGGVGSEVARRLVHAGCKVYLAGRDEGRVAELADELDMQATTIDATRFADVERCVEAAKAWGGRLDGIANCVGSLLLKPAHLTSEEELSDVLAVNLNSAFAVTRAAAKQMRGLGGSVVLVSSAAARTGLMNHEAIAAAKAGVIGLTLSAAATYAPLGIRVNAVAPGLTRTPMTRRITGNEASLKASLAMHALGRIGEVDDIAAAIVWLLGPESTWVTGEVLGVDGGLASVRSRPARQ
jgi:NAD(P)-dependent dehydrogenase (short-subunit alcohol dehydrogenase family)